MEGIMLVTFGERLKETRNSKEITLEKMADDLETTKATLSRYENNLREPKVDFINKVADYLNVTTDYLLCRTDHKNDMVVYDKVDDKEIKIVVSKDDFPDGLTHDQVLQILKSYSKLKDAGLDLLPYEDKIK